MAKTNPIGVRFRPEVLDKLKTEHGIDSPQAALVFLERFYCQHWKLSKDITAPLRESPTTSESKAKQQAKSNNGINTATGRKPRNLGELKALCPPELKDLDRSAWIATERQKYGI